MFIDETNDEDSSTDTETYYEEELRMILEFK
jgi:hypothetical protein